MNAQTRAELEARLAELEAETAIGALEVEPEPTAQRQKTGSVFDAPDSWTVRNGQVYRNGIWARWALPHEKDTDEAET